MQYFYSVFCTLITVSSTQLNLKSLVNLVCMSLDDEEEEETIFFWVTLSIASQCLHPQVIPSSSIPPYCPLMLPSHWCFFFLTTCPFLSFSIPPFLPLSCHSVVKWNEVSAEFIIPPAAVCQQQLSFPHVSLPFFLPSPLPLFVTLTAHLFFTIFHSIMSTPLSFSLIESIPSLLPPSLLFPPQTGLSGRFSHLSTCSLVLFYLHVYVSIFCTPWAHSSMWKTLLLSLRHKTGMSMGLSLSLF